MVDRRSTSQEEEIERWIRHYEKLIVVCTSEAFGSETIRNDIIAAREMQDSRDEWVLFLVTCDGYMNAPRDRYARELSAAHRVFDLPGQTDNSDEYRQAVADLAAALVQVHPASEGGPARSASSMQL